MSAPTGPRAEPDPSSSDRGIRRVGSYQILREIGRGGMGIVYEARHEEIGRRAAIKILRAEYARDPVLTARLLTEARAVSRIQHPGVVSAFDFGHTETGAPYLVMDFLEGVSLRARLSHLRCLGARLAPPAALRIASQIAAALDAAHEQGIIHRDLKPDNVLLVRDAERPGEERAKVLDFGLAKIAAELIRGEPPEDPSSTEEGRGLTEPHMAMGSPAYMAPEQWQSASDVSPKADVYALGVILYEMLAGERPFEAATARQAMKRHLFDPPPPLAARAPGTPAPLVKLVGRMLAKDAEPRPSMAEVGRELAAGLAGTTGAAEKAAALSLETDPGTDGEPLHELKRSPTPVAPAGIVTESAPRLTAAREAETPVSPRGPQRGVGRSGLLALGVVLGVALGAGGASLLWQHRLAQRSERTAAEAQPTAKGATAAMAAASRATWLWQHVESGTQENLYGVWGTSSTDQWIVGGNGTLLHGDGARFTAVPLQTGSGPVDALRAVWGSGPSDVWTVGRSGLVFRYDGQRWSEISSGTDEDLYAVWGTGPSEIWVAGQRGTLLRWDGHELLPVEVPTKQLIRSLWASGPQDLWLVAGSDANVGLVLRWDGKSWASFSLDVRLNKIWGSSSADVWVAGGTLGNHGLLARFDGKRFVTIDVGPAQWLHSIWGSGPADIWVAAESNLLLHWDGAAWTRSESDVPETFRGLWGYGPGDVWAVGTRGAVCRYSGRAWRLEPMPVQANLTAVWQVPAPDGEVFAVGRGGTVLRRRGATWEAIPGAGDVALHAIAGTSADDLWLAGEGGALLRYDGRGLRRVAAGERSLYAAWAARPDEVLFAGEGGALLRWNGQAVVPLTSPTQSTLRAIHGGAAEAWIAGDSGTVLRSTDGVVRVIPSGTRATLRGIFQSAPDQIWAVGDNGTLLRGGASGLQPLPPITPEHLYGIHGSAAGGAWAVGGGGVLLQQRGGAFTKLLSGTRMTLQSVYAGAHGDLWAVGQWGTALHR